MGRGGRRPEGGTALAGSGAAPRATLFTTQDGTRPLLAYFAVEILIDFDPRAVTCALRLSGTRHRGRARTGGTGPHPLETMPSSAKQKPSFKLLMRELLSLQRVGKPLLFHWRVQ